MSEEATSTVSSVETPVEEVAAPKKLTGAEQRMKDIENALAGKPVSSEKTVAPPPAKVSCSSKPPAKKAAGLEGWLVKPKTTAGGGKKRALDEDERNNDMPGSKKLKQVEMESLEKDSMGSSWYKVLEKEFKKPYFASLKKFLTTEYSTKKIFPPMEDIYSWSRLTSLDRVKVVIVGQDPYHGPNQAHGLSFSVKSPTPPPPSLVNIYKQMAVDYPSFVIPKSGDLTKLAELGVLWLNTSLTVEAHKAASHAGKGWETLTLEAIRAVTQRKTGRGVVFLAWGAPASKTIDKLNIDQKKNLILRSAHPSPLSAYRGFHGNGHFLKTNEWLEKTYGEGEGIDWTVLSPPKPAATTKTTSS